MDGDVPIWCYAYPNICFETMYNGEILDYLRGELSLPEKNTWDNFLLFEIEILKSELRMGWSYNVSGYTKIFRLLRYDTIKAVYRITDALEDNPY